MSRIINTQLVYMFVLICSEETLVVITILRDEHCSTHPYSFTSSSQVKTEWRSCFRASMPYQTVQHIIQQTYKVDPLIYLYIQKISVRSLTQFDNLQTTLIYIKNVFF